MAVCSIVSDGSGYLLTEQSKSRLERQLVTLLEYLLPLLLLCQVRHIILAIKMIEEDDQQKYSVGTSQTSQSNLTIRSSSSNFIKLEDLPPARNIPEKNYSVEPDMINGWRPKAKKDEVEKIIIPIQTVNLAVDEIADSIMAKKVNGLKIVYLGARHQSSYEIHQSLCALDKEHRNPYRANIMPLPKSDRSFVGNNPILKSKTLEFNSEIQSGNLDVAIRREQKEYDIFMRVDTNTRGHTSWYNFKVKNHSITGKVRFNIMNFRKERSLYERNMKPFVKRVKSERQWEQQGEVISYKQGRSLFYDFMHPKPNRKMYNGVNSRPDGETLFFPLEEDDEIQIAYCIPYPLSRLNKLITEIRDLEYVQISTLTKSLGNIAIPLISITDPDSVEKKKIVIVTARVHPGESNSSFIAQGLIKSLCVDNFSTKKLRRQYNFKIVPMLNPDGVIAGNYRTGFMGVDLNRVYDQDKICFPQTTALKKLIKSETKKIQHPIDYYVDLHGHSIKKNTFLYGPEHELNSNKYNQCRILAKYLSNLTSMFRYYSCIWRISSTKQATARAVFFKKLNISNCYTMESSNGSYFDRNIGQQKYYDEKSWIELGNVLLKGINQSALQITKQKQEAKNMRTKRQNRRSNLLNAGTKLMQKQRKCSDDEISEGDSDSEPEDNLELDEFLSLRQLLLRKQKQADSEKKLKITLVPCRSQKKYSLHTKARTILTINQQQTKLPIISSQPHKQHSSRPRKTKQLVVQKPVSSKVNISDLIQKRKIHKEQQTGFASIMNRMVLNFNMNVRTNISTKSIKQSEKKSSRYLSRSIVMKQPKPTRFIQNLKFQ